MNTPASTHLEAVRTSRLAAELDAGQAAVLAGLMTLETCAPGLVLSREGSVDQRLYVVVSGTLSVVKNLGSADETLLVTLQADDFAHELGFLDGTEQYASLVAAAESQVLVFERSKLESLIDTHPLILYRVMCAIVRTVHRIQARQSMQAAELTNYVFKTHGRY
jgi:CRP-like cAMP-binding protein